ncbi:malic enzyme [Candidatus Woesearchaeota archaeon]|nr:malic enzyme [Candidatus Woesearchaeota archaeon]
MEDALHYHEYPFPGKVKVIPTKPCKNAADLSLAYTPGVAQPCLKIQQNPDDAYRYTSKGNLVAVISNGTAVLGLGNIGALAGKPVMEGKGILFKRFAGIDVFDLEINEQDPEKLIEIIASLEPTFGGINLEDIKAPECFEIERKLKEKMDIPVFHDDQHGTAVIASAAVLNALELTHRKITDSQFVFSGAGAAAIAIANMLLELGARRERIIMIDSQGVITAARHEKNQYKAAFARETDKKTLAEALVSADVFIGVSQGNILTGQMLKTMSHQPIIIAMANPNPEISYQEAKEAVPDCVMATGRSDYPNQVNNVLCFPFLFRGALDVRATTINLEMKKAAVKALVTLAHLKMPTAAIKAYGQEFTFGPEYIIPKPFDPRLLPRIASAVAKAAMDSGVARKPIADFKEYNQGLRKLALRLARNKF